MQRSAFVAHGVPSVGIGRLRLRPARRIGWQSPLLSSDMIPTRFVLRVLAAALLVASTTAGAAPWQWRDAQGRMVYSDRPPPNDVRAAQIVRSPAPAATPASAASTDASTGAPDGASAPPSSASAAKPAAAPAAPGWVERERAFRARQAERAEEEAKAREESERFASAERACDELRQSIRTLESGLRVVSVNASGEAETLDDAQRGSRLKSARADLERNCSGR